MALPAGKVHFKASEEWQEVLPHHVLPNGLEVAEGWLGPGGPGLPEGQILLNPIRFH